MPTNEPRTIYGSADIATELGIQRNAMSNFITRHESAPRPSYITPDGRKFWNVAGLAKWRRWHADIPKRNRKGGDES